MDSTLDSARSRFIELFGAPPSVQAEAPGRVNLLGEHTDYNDGYVLPTAIPQKMRVLLRENGFARYRVHAESLGQTLEFDLDRLPQAHFAQYVFGCLREVAELGAHLAPLDIYIESRVPMEVGVSSSAALEVATLRALRRLYGLSIDDVMIAQLAQRAEIEYAGVRCGIMDQMACSLADQGQMLFLDTRTLAREVLPLPPDSEILVVDSGVPRTLAGSKYNERRAECEQAASMLGVRALRDVVDPGRLDKLPVVLAARARHVVSENARVLQARQGLDAARFGELMNASHRSLRDDYEVSIPALDELVGLLQEDSSVLGARLTGAGFGGACVALCAAGTAAAVGRRVVPRYDREDRRGRVLVPEAEPEAT